MRRFGAAAASAEQEAIKAVNAGIKRVNFQQYNISPHLAESLSANRLVSLEDYDKLIGQLNSLKKRLVKEVNKDEAHLPILLWQIDQLQVLLKTNKGKLPPTKPLDSIDPDSLDSATGGPAGYVALLEDDEANPDAQRAVHEQTLRKRAEELTETRRQMAAERRKTKTTPSPPPPSARDLFDSRPNSAMGLFGRASAISLTTPTPPPGRMSVKSPYSPEDAGPLRLSRDDLRLFDQRPPADVAAPTPMCLQEDSHNSSEADSAGYQEFGT